MVTRKSRVDCNLLVVEPDAWYGVYAMYFDEGPTFERLAIRKGYNIAVLHSIVDSVKSTDNVRCLIWIERLTPQHVQELGL
jgi:hypothetical protein